MKRPRLRLLRPAALALMALSLASLGRAEGADSVAALKHRTSFLPALFYTPDTKLGGGAVVFTVLSDTLQRRRSSLLMGAGFYTQRHQVLLSLLADLELSGGGRRVAGSVGWRKFPDYFYGIGPRSSSEDEETFTPRVADAQASFQRRIFSRLRPGVRFEARKVDLRDLQAGGVLSAGGVPGSAGGVSAGAGALIEWDDRGPTISPPWGRIWRLESTGFGRLWGSDYSFSRHLADLREYIPAGGDRVVAIRALAVENRGGVPFDRMATLGGESLLRGYAESRYRDASAAILQAEIRSPLWRRFGGVIFCGLGDVAPRLEKLAPRRFKHAFGAGLRFALNQKDRLNLRADLGFGSGSSGFYFGGAEAF